MFYSWAMTFFFSPCVLRGPQPDRCETLPHGWNLAEFYNPTPKKSAAGTPTKKFWAKNMQNFGQFCATSDFDPEYLQNEATYPKSENVTN